MKILLTGKNGQVGWELQRSLAPLGQVKACGRQEADLENLQALRAVVQDFAPDIIVNAAAYTAVDKAETDADAAHRINTEAVGLLAKEAKRLGAWLVHYSTDYVFDGTKSGPYVETDPTNPLSVYGSTKLQGEEAIRQSGCKHLIFRTSWVYASRGHNFAKTMIRLAKERDELNVVADQIGAPTSAELIADVTAHALCQITASSDQQSEGNQRTFDERVIGTYHLAPMGDTSWHGYAKYVLAQAQNHGISLCIAPDKIQAITTAQYPVPAKRPINSRLDCSRLRETFGIELPHWEHGVQRMVNEVIGSD